MDKKIILTRINFTKDNIDLLKEYILKFDNSKDKKIINDAMERITEKIIESSIKINQELLSSINCFSESYYDSFKNLAKLNLFSDDFLKKIANMAGFRNRLAHEYLDLNDEISINTIKKIPEIFSEYLKKIFIYVENN